MTDPEPIERHLRRLQRELADAEWAGDEASAERLRAEIMITEIAIGLGELWVTDF
jgi:hypothetical protein